MLLFDDLFHEVLINPALDGANHLYIVSGYASAVMASYHFNDLRRKHRIENIKVHLIVGMTVQDGLSQRNHKSFTQLVNQDLKNSFECSYLMRRPPVHSKVYAWFRDREPVTGFVGSANYSQKAFSKSQRETMIPFDAEQGLKYFNNLIGDTIFCNHQDAENSIRVFNEEYYARHIKEANNQLVDQSLESGSDINGLEHVKVSFINRYGKISTRSGLNWGHRPEYNRERNQAYIPLKAEVYNTDFFPPIARHFTVHTDDGKILVCTRAQQNGKSIQTPLNNSDMGEYFRRRLNVPNGHFVVMDDFLGYGRTDVDFYKIDEENYFMDFSVETR